jgi:hypothetical protein
LRVQRRRSPRAPAVGRLPTFLVIGVPKAGTTTLAAALGAHPEVFVPREKELHFFDRRFERGLDWYRSWFAPAGAARAAGEATPTYVYDARAMRRLAETLPEARLIVLLRNPVDRAYSNYWYQRSLGYETRSFEEAVRAEMADPDAQPFRHLTRGRYLPYLEAAAELFPRSRLLVLLFEDLRDRPEETLAAACRHVGVDPAALPPGAGRRPENTTTVLRSEWLRRSMLTNPAWRRLPRRLVAAVDRANRARRRYPPMDPSLRAELLAFFERDNAALAAWLGRDLDLWAR